MAQSNPERLSLRAPVFETINVRDGVVLRPLEGADAHQLLAILDADPSIRERVGVASGLHTPGDVVKLVAAEQGDDELIRYAIVENEHVVGLMNFWRAGEFFGDKAEPDDYGFGYFLAPSARGRGLVTDSLQAIMTVAAAHLPIRRFIAFCEADNQASGAVLKKAGFTPSGTAWHDDEHGWTEQKYLKNI
jgi:RimJ/RimL family protein N-acetyltransferase